MVEIDIRRKGKGMDLLKQLAAGKFHIVLASPPRSTFSRARRRGDRGPKPLRSDRYPRGFPWLGPHARKSVADANKLVDCTAAAIATQLPHGGILLESPEGLGRTRTEKPSSIWRWPCIKKLLGYVGVHWGACYQQDFGTDYLKPTRLLLNFLGPRTLGLVLSGMVQPAWK